MEQFILFSSDLTAFTLIANIFSRFVIPKFSVMLDLVKYEFVASFGDQDVTVEMALHGYGSIEFKVGNFCFGVMVDYWMKGWTVWTRGDQFGYYTLTMDDKQALVERAIEGGLIDPNVKNNKPLP